MTFCESFVSQIHDKLCTAVAATNTAIVVATTNTTTNASAQPPYTTTATTIKARVKPCRGKDSTKPYIQFNEVELKSKEVEKLLCNILYTGRFMMYTGNTNIYYRNTVGHVFTKPVQIEGKTEFFPPSTLFFISAARRCEFM